jgi:glucose/arabinose dehydrogenase
MTMTRVSTLRPYALVAAALLGSALVAAQAAELPPGFVEETLATNLDSVTAIAPVADGRILIAEQTGALRVWKAGKLLEPPMLKLHVTDYWERGLIGVTLHPDFPRTPHLFVLFVTDRPFVHHVLSRFTVSGDTAAPTSERVLLEGDDQAMLGGFQPGGHQGGPLRFGSDGKLYVVIGEQTAGEPSQRLDTLQGKILRLNPDGSIPTDNPFYAQATGKYRAIWSCGVRNAYGLATQPETGRFFFTDVGGSAFEEVNELVRGANYGWPYAEGFSTNAAFKNPLHAYPPTVGRSICGGTFYPKSPVKPLNRSTVEPAPASTVQRFNGLTFPTKWRGKFFFADFMNHWVKALDPDVPTNLLTFARGFNGPVAVEVAPDGSLLVLNRGTIWRDPTKFVPHSGSLVRVRYAGGRRLAAAPLRTAPAASRFQAALGLPARANELPRRLSAADWQRRLESSKGRPFWVNGLQWHRLVRERHEFHLPPDGFLALASGDEVSFPPGTVFVREFFVCPTGVSPPGDRRIETRLVVAGAPVGYGASYHWTTPEQAQLIEDGELLDAGMNQALNPVSNHWVQDRVLWWLPSLDEQLSFPITNPSYWLPVAVAEFNSMSSPRDDPNLIALFNREGLFRPRLTEAQLAALPSAARWLDDRATLEQRVRSYLHGNCAMCHQPGGAARAWFDARITAPLEQAGLIDGSLAAGDLGIAGARVIVRGDPERSVLYQRLKRTDFFRMPPVAYHDEASPILPVLAEWIRNLR